MNSLRGACLFGGKDAITALLATGTDINEIGDGSTSLSFMVRIGDIDTATFLLDNGALQIPDNDGFTPLHWAAMCGYENIAALLLARGGDVNAVDTNDETPLHIAALKRGQPGVLRFLISNGANVYARNNNGKTPFEVAINKEIQDILRPYMDEEVKEPETE